MSASKAETIARIRDVIATSVLACPPEQVDDATLAGLDSIGRITLLVELENAFGVELTGQDYDLVIFTSLEHLATFVQDRLAQ